MTRWGMVAFGWSGQGSQHLNAEDTKTAQKPQKTPFNFFEFFAPSAKPLRALRSDVGSFRAAEKRENRWRAKPQAQAPRGRPVG